jgi:hypothetical protein
MPTLLEEAKTEFDALGKSNLRLAAAYPGERSLRQPVHTVYGGAQLYRAETTSRLGEGARRAMATYAESADEFARALGLAKPAGPTGDWLVKTVYERVQQKLAREAVEDFRIDFEDGFGARPDAEEDATAVRAAEEAARALAEGLLPPFLGIRIKSLGEEWKRRAARTLELFVDALLTKTGGGTTAFAREALRSTRTPSWSSRRSAPPRAHGGDDAVSRRAGRPAGAPGAPPRVRRALRRRALRDV